MIRRSKIKSNFFLLEIDEETFDTIFDTNVKGLMLCSKEAIDMMIESEDGGHIVNVNRYLLNLIVSWSPQFVEIQWFVIIF